MSRSSPWSLIVHPVTTLPRPTDIFECLPLCVGRQLIDFLGSLCRWHPLDSCSIAEHGMPKSREGTGVQSTLTLIHEDNLPPPKSGPCQLRGNGQPTPWRLEGCGSSNSYLFKYLRETQGCTKYLKGPHACYKMGCIPTHKRERSQIARDFPTIWFQPISMHGACWTKLSYVWGAPCSHMVISMTEIAIKTHALHVTTWCMGCPPPL